MLTAAELAQDILGRVEAKVLCSLLTLLCWCWCSWCSPPSVSVESFGNQPEEELGTVDGPAYLLFGFGPRRINLLQ